MLCQLYIFIIKMGNQLNQYCNQCNQCNQCNYSENQTFRPQTRFIEVDGCFKHPIRCRKFYISSDSLHAHKINQFIIFTDSSLNMLIPNAVLNLQVEQAQKLQEALECQLRNKNLIVKQQCYVLKAIQQESDDEYLEFKDFPELEKQAMQLQSNKDKKKTHVQEFQLRKKCRAFKLKNPLRKYNIGNFIVVILPMYKSQSDLQILKEGLEQGLAMAEDAKSIGVAQISYMLGYEQSTFQKSIIQYMLCLTKSLTKEYYFKRFSDCAYLTHDSESLELFFKFLNIYINSVKVKRVQSNQTLVTQPSSISRFRKLGPHYSDNTFSTAQKKFVSQNLINTPKLTVMNRQKINSKISQKFGQQNINQLSQILSSEDSQLKGIKLKSLKSKGSSVSDYF